MVAFLLLIVGGLNWLLVGVVDWGVANVTDPISPVLTQAIYVLVGLSAIYELLTHKQSCKACTASGGGSGMGGM